MRARRLITWSAPLGVAAALFASQTIAMAYPAPAASGKVTNGCATVAQGASCTFTFQFFDSGGNAINGLLASLGLDAVSGCSVTPATATTANGGTVSGTLSCAADSGTGSEIVIAQSGNVTVQAAVQIVAASQGQNGSTLPFTSPNPPGPNPWLIAGLALAAIALASGGVYLTRSRRSRSTV